MNLLTQICLWGGLFYLIVTALFVLSTVVVNRRVRDDICYEEEC